MHSRYKQAAAKFRLKHSVSKPEKSFRSDCEQLGGGSGGCPAKRFLFKQQALHSCSIQVLSKQQYRCACKYFVGKPVHLLDGAVHALSRCSA